MLMRAEVISQQQLDQALDLQRRTLKRLGDIMVDAGFRDEARNTVFNVGGDRANTVRELAEAILRVTESSEELRHVPARNEVTHAVADHARMREVFGVVTETSLEDGLRRTWEWAKNIGPVATAPFHDIEVDESLPAIWRA